MLRLSSQQDHSCFTGMVKPGQLTCRPGFVMMVIEHLHILKGGENNGKKDIRPAVSDLIAYVCSIPGSFQMIFDEIRGSSPQWVRATSLLRTNIPMRNQQLQKATA